MQRHPNRKPRLTPKRSHSGHNRSQPQSCMGAASLRPRPQDLGSADSSRVGAIFKSHSNHITSPKFSVCYSRLVEKCVHTRTHFVADISTLDTAPLSNLRRRCHSDRCEPTFFLFAFAK